MPLIMKFVSKYAYNKNFQQIEKTFSFQCVQYYQVSFINNRFVNRFIHFDKDLHVI